MKLIAVLLLLMAAVAAAAEPLKFKAKLGFVNGEDRIETYRFIDGERKLLIVGQRSLQVWDVETAKLISSAPHKIDQFAPGGFVSTYFLLGLPKLLDWRPFVVEPTGRWIVTAERRGTEKVRSAVVRGLGDLKELAVLGLGPVSVEHIAIDPARGELFAFGITDKRAGFGSFNLKTFERREFFTVDQYKWHQPIRDASKLVVGSGSTKVVWSGLNIKEGDVLTLRDVRSGAVEKTYESPGAKPGSAFQDTTVSRDERFIISRRDDRIYVWEIDGDGRPRFVIAASDPKEDLSLKEIVDGRRIVVKIDGRIAVYDIEGDGKPMIEVARRFPKDEVGYRGMIADEFPAIESKGRLRIFDARGGTKLEIASDVEGDTIELADWRKDGKFIAVRDDRRILVFDLHGNGKPLYTIERDGPKERFHSVRIIERDGLLAVTRVNNSEKKEPRTEFYDLETGKFEFAIGIPAGADLEFGTDRRLFFQRGIGSFWIWNHETKTATRIPLDTYTSSCDNDAQWLCTESETRNTEFVELSPDKRFAMKWGGKLTELFDIETGQRVQLLSDPATAKFRKGRLVNSGLGRSGWTANGRYAFALDDHGLLDTARTVNIWER